MFPESPLAVWHGFVAGVGAGQVYGFRVNGAFDPAHGLRYNLAKLLFDLYVRAIVGEVRYEPEVLGHTFENPCASSRLDSAADLPRSVVLADMAPAVWRLGHALADTIFYKVHMRGFTATHPGVPPALRGTYAGLAHGAALDHQPPSCTRLRG